MSMKQTKGQKTNGKENIKMREAETYGKKMVKFSNGTYDIYRKMNKFISMYNVDAAFLVFSQDKKPYTFAYPSMEEVADQFMNHLRPESLTKKEDITKPLVDAYRKHMAMKLMTKYMASVKELDMEKKKEKMLKEMRNQEELRKWWWNTPLESLSMEGLKLRHQIFEELYDMSLSLIRKDNEASSSGHGKLETYGI